MTHGSEILGVVFVEEGILKKAEIRRLRMIFGVQLLDRVSTKDLMGIFYLTDLFVKL